MKQKNYIRGQLMVGAPQPFRLQQLSVVHQRKDKKIRTKLQCLEHKRIEHQDLQKQWEKQQQNYKQFVKYQESQDQILRKHEQQLRKSLFMLSIRKQQIESRTNPEIITKNIEKLAKYLRCTPYTVGNHLEKVIFWSSEKKYLTSKFLVCHMIDRFFKKSETRKQIANNIQKIVYSCKVKFETQWIMVTLKEVRIEGSMPSTTSQNKSKHNPIRTTQKIVFELSVYALTPPNFSFKKQYTYDQLTNWLHILGGIENEPVINRPRLSVADNLAKLNALKQLQSITDSNNSQSSKEVNFEDLLSKDKSVLFDKQKTINEQNESEMQSSQHDNHDMSSQMISQQSQNRKSSNEQDSDCVLGQYQNSSQQSSDNDSSESQKEKNRSMSRKTLRSKSQFYLKSKTENNHTIRLNKKFIGGKEEILLPPFNPIENLVILIKSKELYFLQEYLTLQEKANKIKIALARFRLKVRMKKQLKKCLFYRVINISQFYETKMCLSQAINLPFLFMVKKKQSSHHHQLQVTASPLKQHPMLPVARDLASILYHQKQHSQKSELKQSSGGKRQSGMKLRNNVRKSRELKRKSNIKPNLKIPEHQKSSFHANRKTGQFTPSQCSMVRSIFDEFMKNNVIWLEKHRFITHLQFILRKTKVIYIQANFKRKIQGIKYRDLKSGIVCKSRYFTQHQIFVSCFQNQSEQNIKVFIQSLQLGSKQQIGFAEYPIKYAPVILSAISLLQIKSDNLPQQKEFFLNTLKNEVYAMDLRECIKQKQKPQKQKLLIKRFMYMVYLKTKTRKNTFLIKKIVVKQRLFILIIRRDSKLKSILKCSLYDFPGCNLKTSNNKEIGSEYGWQKQLTHHSSKQFNHKPFCYQHIYLHRQYFDGIQKKNIPDEFLIEHKVFLLKPPKTPSIYYIERLCAVDINCQEIAKELATLEKQDYSNYKITTKKSYMFSSKSIKNNISENLPFIKIKQSSNVLRVIPPKPKYNNLQQQKRMAKRNSLQNNQLLDVLKQSIIRQYTPQTHKSVVDSVNQKYKQGFRIEQNSHDSNIYLSLYKSEDIFYYLDLYIVLREQNQKNYSQKLSKLTSFRLYKKQLQDMGNLLIIKKIATWIHENENLLVEIIDQRDRIDQVHSKIELEEGLNYIGKCLQILDNNNKRFSCDVQANHLDFGQKEKGSRTNTINI